MCRVLSLAIFGSMATSIFVCTGDALPIASSLELGREYLVSSPSIQMIAIKLDTGAKRLSVDNNVVILSGEEAKEFSTRSNIPLHGPYVRVFITLKSLENTTVLVDKAGLRDVLTGIAIKDSVGKAYRLDDMLSHVGDPVSVFDIYLGANSTKTVELLYSNIVLRTSTGALVEGGEFANPAKYSCGADATIEVRRVSDKEVSPPQTISIGGECTGDVWVPAQK